MELQTCPFCQKEFMPPKDGRSHTYCSRLCRVHNAKKLCEEDKKNRKEMGLPKRSSFCSSVPNHLFGDPYDL